MTIFKQLLLTVISICSVTCQYYAQPNYIHQSQGFYPQYQQQQMHQQQIQQPQTYQQFPPQHQYYSQVPPQLSKSPSNYYYAQNIPQYQTQQTQQAPIVQYHQYQPQIHQQPQHFIQYNQRQHLGPQKASYQVSNYQQQPSYQNKFNTYPPEVQYNPSPAQQPRYNNVQPQLSRKEVDTTQYYPKQNTIPPPIHRTESLIKVGETFSGSTVQNANYNSDSLAADLPPPPPPEKFMPESSKVVGPKMQQRTKNSNVVKDSHAVRGGQTHNENRAVLSIPTHPQPLLVPTQQRPVSVTQTLIAATQAPAPSTTRSPLPDKKQERIGSSPPANAVFLQCCRTKKVSTKCESRCNFDVLSKKVLTGMFLGSDPCPQSFGRDLFSCAAQDSDHTDCCKRMNVARTPAGEKCYAFCKMTPGTEFTVTLMGAK